MNSNESLYKQKFIGPSANVHTTYIAIDFVTYRHKLAWPRPTQYQLQWTLFDYGICR